MPDNKNRKYLIVVEIEQTGFIVGIKTKYLEATKVVDKLTNELEVFGWNEQAKTREFLVMRGYIMYTINGNVLYSDKGVYGSTDGRLSIMAIPVKFSSICVSLFIRERENSSALCRYNRCWYKQLDKYFENTNFPLTLAN